MLNQRCIEILMELCNHSGEFLTGSYLAQKFSVSLRTIQNDMREIKKEMERETCAEIVSQTSKGTKLEIHNYDEYSVLISSLYQQYATASLNYSVSRVDSILLFLLNKFRAVSLYDMAEKFFISESTLRNDLKKVENILNQYGLELLFNRNKAMVDGREVNKRQCLASQNLYLAHLKDENGNLYIDERQLTRIKDALTEVFVRHKYFVMDEDFHNIILFINIMLHRVWGGFRIQPNEVTFQGTQDETEYVIAGEALKKIGQTFAMDLPQPEIECFAAYLKGKRIHENSDVISSEVNDFILSALESIRETYGYDFTDNVNLRISLALHCISLSARVKYDMQMENDMLEYIRESFPMGYDLGTYFGHLLGLRYGKKVTEDEIALLGVHFYSGLLENRFKNGKKKILVLTTLKKSMTVLLKQTLLKWFSEEVSVIDMIYPMNITDEHLDKYDVFLTTEKNRFYEMGLAMLIDHFPKEKDYFNIKLNLDGFKSVDSITAMFRRNLFTVLPKAEKGDVLKQICQQGTDLFELEGLYEQVMAREGIGSTFFTKGIAVPHPMAAVSSDTFLVVCVSEKPIIWDEDGNTVHLVVLMHIGKNNSQAFQLWDYFSKIFADKTLIARMLRNPTYENFLALIRDAIENGISSTDA